MIISDEEAIIINDMFDVNNATHGAVVAGVCNGDYCDYWQEFDFKPMLSMDGKFLTCNTTHYGWDNNGTGVNMVDTTSAYFGITVTGTSHFRTQPQPPKILQRNTLAGDDSLTMICTY